MKGQYIILREFLFFAVGIGIIIFVVMLFSKVETSISNYNIEQGFDKITNRIIDATILTLKNEDMNSTIILEIPVSIANNVYTVELDKNITLYTKKIFHSQNVFNISNKYNINGNVTSPAGKIKISFNGTRINIRRVFNEKNH